MKSYRAGFLAALTGNLVLLGVVAALWWHDRSTPRIAGAASTPMGSAALAPDSPRPDPPPSGTASGADRSSAGSSPTSAGADQTEQALAPVQLSPQRLQSIGVTFGEVESKTVSAPIRTTGNVAVDETKLAYVQTRFSGYIQKVFVDATYQSVRKGQPLFTIYSPDLVSTEREYLAARQNQKALARSADPEVVRDAASLVTAAAARLKQWNIPKREIARLESTGQVQQNLEIDSPATGFITEREALPGKYAQPDTRLYTVADLSSIWVFAQVYQNDLGRLHAGNRATLTVDTYPGRTFSGHVDFIYPDIDMSTRTARVRLKFPNPGLKLIPGMFVNVTLDAPMGTHEVIPASGVLQTGTRQIVFVDRGGGSLEPRQVEVGARVGDDYIVLKGLEVGERIATSANFLIDSESQLQAALGAFAPPPPGASATSGANAPQASIELSTDPTPPQKGSNVMRVKLVGAGGTAVPGAHLTATFFMAAMPAMGMAAMRVLAPLGDRGNGLYEGPVRLGSGGTWQVTIVAQKNGQTIASKQLSIDVTGGM